MKEPIEEPKGGGGIGVLGPTPLLRSRFSGRPGPWGKKLTRNTMEERGELPSMCGEVEGKGKKLG